DDLLDRLLVGGPGHPGDPSITVVAGRVSSGPINIGSTTWSASALYRSASRGWPRSACACASRRSASRPVTASSIRSNRSAASLVPVECLAVALGREFGLAQRGCGGAGVLGGEGADQRVVGGGAAGAGHVDLAAGGLWATLVQVQLAQQGAGPAFGAGGAVCGG